MKGIIKSPSRLITQWRHARKRKQMARELSDYPEYLLRDMGIDPHHVWRPNSSAHQFYY